MGNNLGKGHTGPTAGQIKYVLLIGPVIMVAAYAKEDENDYSVGQYPLARSIANDRDYDSYRAGPIFNWKANNFRRSRYSVDLQP